MNRRLLVLSPPAVALGFALLFSGAAAEAADSASVKALFANPPRQYASAPLWVWNDMLTEEQIKDTMNDLASQEVKQAFVHPRPGLMTPYLGPDWFRLWKVALAEAERLDMNLWIYDENSYPSGFAGGLVPEAMPESRGKGLHFGPFKPGDKLGDDVLAVYRVTGEGGENVTAKARAGEALPEGQYLVARIALAPHGGWFGGKYYVDLLRPGVTEKFLEITMGAYQREIGEHFGKRVPGVFTDEPNLIPAGPLPWSEHVVEEFQKRWGYNLLDRLPSLAKPVGDWKRVRHNYFQVLLEQYIEHWGKPYYEYCAKNGLEFTGHYWEHDWPACLGVPDNMAMYAWHQRPSIDILMNEYREDTNAQFGNTRAVKELGSVANQLGRQRTLCEAYGAGGWDLRFEDMKRIGDWMYALGVNTLDEHLSYVTLRGARKNDHPQSFSYHEPWWEAYHIMAEHFTRLSLAISSGEQVNSVLLLEPTTSAWIYQAESPNGARLGEIGKTFQEMVDALERAQAEYDIGCEDIMARHGAVEGGVLRVGKRQYELVVLPPCTENLNAKTMDLLEAYTKAGGKVLCCGEPPAMVDGQPSDRGRALAQSAGWKQVEAPQVPALVLASAKDGFAIARADGDKGILFHHRRRLDDAELLLLVNTSIDSPSSGTIQAAVPGVEQWDLATGTVSPYPFVAESGGAKIAYDLPPCGSLLLLLSKNATPPAAAAPPATIIEPSGPTTARRIAPNVLTLDYVDITAGGETKKDLYMYQANQFAFQKNGMERNPWDSAVQLRDELITKKFPPESGFEATYRFTIQGYVPGPLWIVIERPDLYTITCNGKPVAAKAGEWWLDKAFGKIDITGAVKLGENAVTIKAAPFTIYHELAAAYVLGDFALRPMPSGFVLTPPRRLGLGNRDAHGTTPDGTMWLSAGIGFHGEGNDGEPWIVFDLGQARDLGAIRVWNYNEVNLTKRGVKDVEITGSATGEDSSFTVPIGKFTLDQATSGSTGPSSKPDFPQGLTVDEAGVRFVKFRILSNHSGVNFPTTDGSNDNAFVGLSEVHFFGKPEGNRVTNIPDVTVAKVSSELDGKFNRLARFLVDGAGLSASGWNRQGCPFYAAGVAYCESFEVPQPAGRYFVSLPAWCGSVAKVLVNGKQAGYIGYRPWECDVTECIQPGTNTVEVVVIGTLKNTLGPHHVGATAGRAWPGMFHTAPNPGPPPGDKYDTIGYGLFRPFVLKQVGGR